MYEDIKRISTGFTMVEMMLVVLLLGIVAAVAVPAINSSLDEMKLDSAAREVVSAIQYVQSLAIKEGIEYKVNFNPIQERFWCFDVPTGLTILHPVDKKPYDINFTAEGHLQGVDIVSASFIPGNISSITFNSLGEPDVYGSVDLGYRGYQRTINVTRLVGKVTVN